MAESYGLGRQALRQIQTVVKRVMGMTITGGPGVIVTGRDGKWFIRLANGGPERREQGGLFPVYVTQSGGSAGDRTTECSFTYNVFTDSARTIQIGTTVALQKSRLVNCTMAAGTLGIAYYEAGTLKLWDVNERASQSNC